ncbi:hypothetical protein ASE00_14320 [Sphingomonas sp. Root710]|uniref:response regulator n=1 Tax=Sphingomonas sp. Root710 TaxID=1736594 RepID=UPI0006F4A83D|nr:response regulator [Sphingomonas sp. Root710]KRB81180.1 hypothetical protein ASE00_14320 [Sphingomonas sp. Root710]
MTAKNKARLLLIEDDAGVRRSLQLLLHGERFEVHAFSSAGPALAEMAFWQPTHAVIDYCLPDGDGVEALRALRANGWNGTAILITAFDTRDVRKAAADAGFSAVLSKPFADSRLVETLRRGQAAMASAPSATL